ncbi:M1 family metallopeptidase [Maribacter polysaccharolyticus]|uniref:M1 family metallopeptidase n=1 Tax=Maribacter polysaccharolyticus TaxID=3020831 RepID=UPI00237F4385|nr:M1 family aminopeptidase [Maribacter polysaccharolyticus]MDE3740506.1 M1 family aminopeptidase [Maribacter polysaccharolyticus]
MKSISLLLLFALVLPIRAANPITDNYPKNPNIDAIDYVFRISLSDTSDEIQCEETVEIRYLAAGETTLRLDLVKASKKLDQKGMMVSKVISEGKLLDFTHDDAILAIQLPEPSKTNQYSSYTISYKGVPATGLKIGDNKYGDRTFFSDNWPNKGRNWLATIDHPYDKATCEFIVSAPTKYQVVSNGLKIEETDLGNGQRLTHWKQSVPIATWLYVLGVAEFAVQYVDEFEGKSIESWVYPQNREAGFYDFAIPTKRVLEFYSDWVGPFSYEKLANIQSNSVSGGMEAASAILYSENSVVGDRNERWRNVVIHEIAHQWFGNAVTEYDWDDVWLSEGFATYFTLLFIEHEYGHDEFLQGLAKSKEMVDDFYAKNPEYRIVHDNLSDMSQVTSRQTYQKGSWILHMLRGVVGTDVFWKGIQAYYKKYKDLNATTADFQKEMEKASGLNLEYFFQQWLYKPGTLKYQGNWTYDDKNRKVTLRLDQVQHDGSFFRMPLEIGIYGTDGKHRLIEKVQVDKKSNSFTFTLDFIPEQIVLDPNSWVLMEADFVKKQ